MNCILFALLLMDGQVAFEVASVKPVPVGHLPPMMQKMTMGRAGRGDPGRVRYPEVTLKTLLAQAYVVRESEISGPEWLDTELYEVIAKAPEGSDVKDVPLMLQALLLDRFQIALHRETRTLAVYELTVAKNGPKLGAPEAEREYRDEGEKKADLQARAMASLMEMKGGGPHRRFHLGSASITKFAAQLEANLDRPVIDKTQLDGLYSFTLAWDPDDTPGLSVFVAIEEQLGLKLVGKKEVTEVLVIDRASKVPISN